MKLKELPKQFNGKAEVSGVTFTQLKRDGKVALYKRDDSYYEVVVTRVKKYTERISSGDYTHYEQYPTATSFGLYGWCIRDYNRALIKYRETISECCRVTVK